MQAEFCSKTSSFFCDLSNIEIYLFKWIGLIWMRILNIDILLLITWPLLTSINSSNIPKNISNFFSLKWKARFEQTFSSSILKYSVLITISQIKGSYNSFSKLIKETNVFLHFSYSKFCTGIKWIIPRTNLK